MKESFFGVIRSLKFESSKIVIYLKNNGSLLLCSLVDVPLGRT